MRELFLSVLNMSLTASYVILFVILIRLLLKKAPKFISYALWGVVAFRLIIPFSFESMFSLMPRNTNTVPIPHDITYQQIPQSNSGIEVFDLFVSESLPTPTVGASVNPLQIYTEIATYIWVIGIIALLVYSLVSILVLKRQLKNAQLIEQNIYESKNLKTPFVLGLARPKIYLPVGLNATERGYILLHEQTHIHRKDHIIKILSFLILSIHWFNPLVWIAFMLMGTDMELSCDEKVLKEMNEDIKKPYANSLLSLATGRQILNGSPLAFGEGNVRGRIKNVLNYRKPRFWVIVFSIIILTVAGIGLMANPKAATIEPTAPELSFEQTVGVDMVQLDYASNNIVIFHDYFGLFVYDISSHQIARSLDLRPLNCHQTQGDNYCEVTVSMDGNTVQLHPMSSENMFVYTISDNTLQKTAYNPMNNPFRSQFVPIEEVINSTKLGNYSHLAVRFDTGEYGYIYTEDGTIGTLVYKQGDMVFRLFDINKSSVQSTTNNTTQDQYDYFWENPSDNGLIPFSGYLRKVQLKMQHEIETRDLSISEDAFSQLFSLLSKADEAISPKSESFLDGYKLMLVYESQNNQSILVKLIGLHDGKTIFADIESADGEDYLKDRTNYFQSSELVNYIKTMVEWKEFDVQNLSGVNEISVQTMVGVQKTDTATRISGKDADTITNSIIKNSKREEAGNCGYNIKVIFKKEDGTEYHALLAGDSCPDIAIEGCVFRIDPEIIKLIYKKINYDMPIGNS